MAALGCWTKGLKQSLLTQIPLKMKKNAFYFTPKALFVSRYKSWLFCHVVKWLEKKYKVNVEFYDVTAWLKNNCNTYIAQYLKK